MLQIGKLTCMNRKVRAKNTTHKNLKITLLLENRVQPLGGKHITQGKPKAVDMCTNHSQTLGLGI